MGKEKNIMKMVNQNLKVIIYMEQEMGKEQNIIKMESQNLKVNIFMGKNGMENNILLKIIIHMNSQMEKGL